MYQSNQFTLSNTYRLFKYTIAINEDLICRVIGRNILTFRLLFEMIFDENFNHIFTFLFCLRFINHFLVNIPYHILFVTRVFQQARKQVAFIFPATRERGYESSRRGCTFYIPADYFCWSGISLGSDVESQPPYIYGRRILLADSLV